MTKRITRPTPKFQFKFGWISFFFFLVAPHNPPFVWPSLKDGPEETTLNRMVRGERRGPALRILNHCRTSVSLHCADFIDYFTTGNIVNLFIPRRRPSRHRREVAPLGAHNANYASREVLLPYSSLDTAEDFRVTSFQRLCVINFCRPFVPS